MNVGLYTVGLIDSEGCFVTGRNQHGSPYFRISVELASEEAIDFLHTNWKGSRSRRTKPTAGGIYLSSWSDTIRHNPTLVRLLAKNSLIKRKQAIIAQYIIDTPPPADVKDALVEHVRSFNGARSRFANNMTLSPLPDELKAKLENDYWQKPVDFTSYAIGFFDGEGSVTFNIVNGKTYFNVGATNTNRDVLAAMQAQFGGTIHEEKRKTSGGQIMYYWYLKRSEILDFLRLMQSGSIIMRSTIDVGIEIAEHLSDYSRGADGRRLLAQGGMEERLALIDRLKATRKVPATDSSVVGEEYE